MGSLFLADRIIPNGIVIMAGNRIADCGSTDEVMIPEDAEIIDAGGNYIAPGFVDIHCHAGGGRLAYLHPHHVALAHLKHGTTSLLPTLSYNESREETIQGVTNIVEAMESNLPYKEAIAGIHMEGPYINKKYGAVVAPIRPPDPEEYNEVLRIAGKDIKLWTLAPEIDGQDEFITAASRYAITFSVGHSEATAEQIFRYVPYGLRIGCHCTNASGTTPSKSRYGGTREIGVDEAVLVNDDIYAEVIPDYGGVHVRPLMLELIRKTKGNDKVIIITDNYDITSDKPEGGGFSPEGMSKEALDDVNFTKVGLSGSRLTMDKAVRNMMMHTGIGIVEAFKMGSLNPAVATNMHNMVGSIEKWKYANILIVNENIEIQQVFLHGEAFEL